MEHDSLLGKLMLLEKNNLYSVHSIYLQKIILQAWIFDAIPAFGELIGGKKEKRKRPRFFRYKYVKDNRFPTEEQITQVHIPLKIIPLTKLLEIFVPVY